MFPVTLLTGTLSFLILVHVSVSQNGLQETTISDNDNTINLPTTQSIQFGSNSNSGGEDDGPTNSQFTNIDGNSDSINIPVSQKIGFDDATGMSDMTPENFFNDGNSNGYDNTKADNSNEAIGLNQGDTVANSG